MRKKLLALLSTVFTLAIALSLVTMTAFADTTATDYSADSTKWMWKDGVEITDTGMNVTAPGQYIAISNPLAKSDLDMTVVIDENLSDGQWQYNTIFFKVDDFSAIPWSPANGLTSKGNWLAYSFDHGTGAAGLYECVNGVVTKVADSSISGYDLWYLYAQKNTVTIKANDTATGVAVTVTYKASDCRKEGNTNTGTTHTYTYTSTNAALKGAGKYIGYYGHGAGTITAENGNYIKINMNVTESDAVISNENDYATDASKWTSLTGATVTNKGIVTNASSSKLVTKEIGGNSTVEVTMASPATTGTWQYEWIMVKSEGTDTAWTPIANKGEGNPSTDKNWLGVAFGGSAGNFFFVECVDGVVTQTPNYVISNFAHWYSDEQTTKIVLTTTDTDTGVKLDVTFTSSDCANASGVEETYNVSYTSTNTKLWGDQKVLIGHNGANTNPITYNVVVDNIASEYEYAAPVANDYATDATKWASLSGASVTASGIVVSNAGSYTVVSNELEGNSEMTVTVDNCLSDGQWQYIKVFFKADNTDCFNWSPANGTASTGNWMAFVLNHGEADSADYFGFGNVDRSGLYECVDGVVSKVKHIAISGYDNWYLYNQKNTITIKTTDTENGVDATVTFNASECRKAGNTNSGNTYKYNYSSTNKKVWGKGTLAVASFGAGTITAENGNYIKINAIVNEAASEYDYEAPVAKDYAADSTKWMWTDGVEFTENGSNVTAAGQYIGISHPVQGNYDMTFVVDSALADGSWQYNVIFLKIDDFSAIPWSPAGSNPVSKGNWIAFVLNHGETDAGDVFGGGEVTRTGLYECVDGVVRKVQTLNVSGFDNWYLYNQKNTFVISVKDTAEGVDVNVAFTASDCRKAGNTNTGNTYGYKYSSTNKKLWGSTRIGYYGHGGGSITGDNYINLNAFVVETASEYSADAYNASVISELITKLPTEINGETYGAGKEAYVAAKTAYDAASDTVKALVVGAEKITAIGEAIAEYEANNTPEGITAKISALPTEVTKENYAAASVAIREAKALYGALSAEDQALVSNVDTLNSIYNVLVAYEADVEVAAGFDAIVEALPAEVNRINYKQSLVEQFAAAKVAYEALTEAQKAHVTTLAAYEAAVASLAAYEESLKEPAFDAANLAQSADNWNRWGNVNAGAVEYSNYGMTLTAPAAKAHKAVLLRKNVKADSTITVRFDGQANAGMWGQNFVMFKNLTAEDALDAGAPVNAINHGGIAAAPAGTWMAIMFGDSYGFNLMICVDGVLTEIPFTNVESVDYNDAVQQITDLVIRTVDTADGVEVYITYTASGIAGLSGNTWNLEYTVAGDTFKGDYAVSVGSYYGEGGTQKVIVTNVKVEGPEGTEGLVERVSSDNSVNFATDLKYWKAGNNVSAFTFREGGMTLWDVKYGGMVLNHKVQDQQTIKINIDGSLQAAYGNLYFVFKHKEPTVLYGNGVLPAASGNYLVLMIGGDGCKIFECVDGVVNAKQEANGAITGGTELKVEENTDAWYIYNQYTRLEIYTEDVEDGVDVFITLKGASGKTTVLSYFSSNTALHGDSYFGIEYFLGAEGGANGVVTVESVKIAGVTEGFVPNVNVEELNASLEAACATEITAANVANIEATYASASEAYISLNYTQGKAFNKAYLDTLKAKIDAYYADVAAAAAVDEMFAALLATVNADNYAEVKAAYDAATTAYNGLGVAGKAAVTQMAAYTACGDALAAHEADVAAAAAVDALIDAIPAISKENYDEAKVAVEAAESAYAALTETQKSFVKGGETLKAKRNELEKNAGCVAGMGATTMLALAALAVATILKKKAE